MKHKAGREAACYGYQDPGRTGRLVLTPAMRPLSTPMTPSGLCLRVLWASPWNHASGLLAACASAPNERVRLCHLWANLHFSVPQFGDPPKHQTGCRALAVNGIQGVLGSTC